MRDDLSRLVRRWIEQGWQSRDPRVVEEMHAPDFIDHDPGAAPTGKQVTFKDIEILRIRNGLITERWGEWDGIDLLEQLGRLAP